MHVAAARKPTPKNHTESATINMSSLEDLNKEIKSFDDAIQLFITSCESESELVKRASELYLTTTNSEFTLEDQKIILLAEIQDKWKISLNKSQKEAVDALKRNISIVYEKLKQEPATLDKSSSSNSLSDEGSEGSDGLSVASSASSSPTAAVTLTKENTSTTDIIDFQQALRKFKQACATHAPEWVSEATSLYVVLANDLLSLEQKYQELNRIIDTWIVTNHDLKAAINTLAQDFKAYYASQKGIKSTSAIPIARSDSSSSLTGSAGSSIKSTDSTTPPPARKPRKVRRPEIADDLNPAPSSSPKASSLSKTLAASDATVSPALDTSVGNSQPLPEVYANVTASLETVTAELARPTTPAVTIKSNNHISADHQYKLSSQRDIDSLISQAIDSSNVRPASPQPTSAPVAASAIERPASPPPTSALSALFSPAPSVVAALPVAPPAPKPTKDELESEVKQLMENKTKLEQAIRAEREIRGNLRTFLTAKVQESKQNVLKMIKTHEKAFGSRSAARWWDYIPIINILPPIKRAYEERQAERNSQFIAHCNSNISLYQSKSLLATMGEELNTSDSFQKETRDELNRLSDASHRVGLLEIGPLNNRVNDYMSKSAYIERKCSELSTLDKKIKEKGQQILDLNFTTAADISPASPRPSRAI